MKKAIIRTTLFVIASCSVLFVAAQEKNNPVCINRSYAPGISNHLKLRIDSTVNATVARFNAENHSFTVTTAPSQGSHQVSLDFSQARLATKGQRTTAYLVNLIAPVYHPKHKIISTVSYPEGFYNGKTAKISSRTNVLFANIHAKEDKLLRKYADRLYNELKNLDQASNISKL